MLTAPTKEEYYLEYNRDNIFTNLIQSEQHFRAVRDDMQAEGHMNCIVKHLADAEGEAGEAISHALVVEGEESSGNFKALKASIRTLRKRIQTEKITSSEGIIEIRKLRRQFESENPAYDVSKCASCGPVDPGKLEELEKAIEDFKSEAIEPRLQKLSACFGVKPGEVRIVGKGRVPCPPKRRCKGAMGVTRNGTKVLFFEEDAPNHTVGHEYYHLLEDNGGVRPGIAESERNAAEFGRKYERGASCKALKESPEVKILNKEGLKYSVSGARNLEYKRPVGFIGTPIASSLFQTFVTPSIAGAIGWDNDMTNGLVGVITGGIGLLAADKISEFSQDLLYVFTGAQFGPAIANWLAGLTPAGVRRTAVITGVTPRYQTSIPAMSPPPIEPALGASRTRYTIHTNGAWVT